MWKKKCKDARKGVHVALLKGWGSRCAQVDDSRIKKQEHGSKKEVGNGSVLGCPCDKCSLWGGHELQT